MASVTIRNAVKSYGTMEVLHGVSLAAQDGEFVVLVGPSGCGKSTLLRMIAGLESITDGDIDIGGRVVNELEPKERDIAMVFQSYALYPHMTVRDNMGFALKLSRRSRKEIEDAVNRAAGILALEPLLDRYPRQLSGGQRQRVAMGRAIVRNPAVFLFDEPLSNLDAKLRVQMRSEIKALHQRLGSTMIYVTHDQMEAMTMADRIVVMRAGRIEQIGTPLEIYDTPANSFVGSFIGSPSMNLIEGVVIDDAGAAALKGRDGTLWSLPGRAAAYKGRSIQLGIRPEHIHIKSDGIAAEIRTVEPTGAETHVQMQAGDTPVVAVLRDRPNLAPGGPLSFGFDVARAGLFDLQTGNSLA
ncbi:ABC transporter ATP-binding protein [Paradevosia shaoguanensis]|uniref:Sn-glycerol-3-phosphate ABC transporter ATP-binding protein UgpC n=1 Tax=Paradevosia shaoguanensis TaxID=1335043 RepID=A0AA41QLG5_9HYPH|nr:sn-glycerol-3-phosphate ABC transporter ATP-binding protein UgpC [Paradevosia shaoguanensis]MCF1741496.1 sn-glycerol-3-phosphate ABC transporter ATP-binding protein UgpC [Paradevosia shaoguanensis]MCI0125979.1 sn-glycerol-3-phosphate ABC transporter ATP-binding protein UgpC [Paradevosia shaoguanensis]